MRKLAILLSLVGLVLALALPVSAKGPTCAGMLGGLEVHGHHIVADYVTGVGHVNMAWPPAGEVNARGGAVLPGGPGPGFHFPGGHPPGASFCLEQANSGVIFEKNPTLSQ